MKSKEILSFAFIFFAINAVASDGYLSNLTIGKYLKTNVDYTIGVNVLNNTNDAITSCQVIWQLDNGATHSNSYNIGGGGITSGNYLPVNLTSASLNLPATGTYTLKVWVTTAGDVNHANDTIKKQITALSSYVNNKVLIEELSGTWCPQCPPGSEAIEVISTNPNAIVATFHAASNDPYEIADGATYMYDYFPTATHYFPSAIINMGEMGSYDINSYTSSWLSDVESRIDISPVDVQLTTNFNTTTRLLTVTTTVNFKYAFTGTFLINAYVLQNNISGTQNTPNGYIPYVHQHVVRNMLGGSTGTSGVIPATPVANTNYTHEYTMTIPTAWNINDIDVIGYVFEKSGSNTNMLNAAQYSFTTGINDVSVESPFLDVYPNPLSTTATLEVKGNKKIDEVTLMNIFGEKLNEKQINIGINQSIVEVDLSNYPPGIYFLHVKSGNEIMSKKIIKQ